MATRCKFRGRRDILCDVLKIDGSLARNIDFEVANFHVLRKTRRKTSIFKLQSVKIGGSLARNARFGAPTCLVSSLCFSCGLAVSMGEAAKLLLCACFQLWNLAEVSHEMLVLVLPPVSSRVSSFLVASQARHFVTFQPCFIPCRKSFCVAGAILLRPFHKMTCTFRGRRNILQISAVILRGRRSTSDVSHCVLYTDSTLHTLHSALHTPPLPLHTFHTLHSTLQTLHFTLYTLRSTLYTPHSTLYTLHSTLSLHTLHFTLSTLDSTVHTLNSTLYTLKSTLHTPHSTHDTHHFTLYT